MSIKFEIAKKISDFYSIRNYVLPNSQDYRILMYHAIGSKVINDPKNIYSLDKHVFRDQMIYLSNHYSDSLKSFKPDQFTQSNEKAVMLTFDDGYKDNIHNAAPILCEFNIPFTIFITTKFVQDKDPNFLSPSEIRQMSEISTANFGSHGYSHKSLAECSETQLKRELEDSKKFLEDILGRRVDSIAYPNGSVNSRVINAAEDAGYILGGTSFNNRNNSNSDPLFLARTCIFSMDSMNVFKQKVRGDWDWLKYIQNPSKVSRELL